MIVAAQLYIIQCSYLLCATFRVAYGNDITGLFAAPLRDLLRRHARCYPRMRALLLLDNQAEGLFTLPGLSVAGFPASCWVMTPDAYSSTHLNRYYAHYPRSIGSWVAKSHRHCPTLSLLGAHY